MGLEGQDSIRMV